jgi:hypothetical protein
MIANRYRLTQTGLLLETAHQFWDREQAINPVPSS